MEKTCYKLSVWILFVFLISRISAKRNENSFRDCNAIQPPISKIIHSLSSRLIKEIGPEGNYFFSPLSISAALSMIYLGAGGTTKAQMTNVLKNYLPIDDQSLELKLNEESHLLVNLLEDTDKSTSLLAANSVFIRKGSRVSSNYTSKLQEYWNSDIQYLDFANEEQKTLKTINQWVSNHTNGQISKLLNEPLDHLTMMILMNVIYFKGLWQYPFDKRATWDSFFYNKYGTAKRVPFMMLQQELNYFYDVSSNTSFLELNYGDGRISMLLILPKDVQEYPRLELTSQLLCELRSLMKPTDVMVVLPKFRLQYSRELSQDISKMGMDELFSDKADLSGIREENDIHVSLMLHKAVIQVDEDGSEASVVTGVGIDGRKKIDEQNVFWADHAFLFNIIHKATNTILFSGRVSELS